MTIKYGDRFSDFRYDPIDQALVPQEIQGSDGFDGSDPNGEFHQALLLKGTNNKYGFSPIEMPFRDTSIPNSGIIVYEIDDPLTNVAIGSPLTQVRPPIGSQPGLTEYAVDFNNPIPYLNTGRIIVNSANANKYYRMHRYFGMGGINSVANTMAIEAAVLSTKLSRDGSLAMTGPLNMGTQKITSLANGVSAGDAVNVGQIPSLLSGSVQSLKGCAEYVLPQASDTITDDKYIYQIQMTGSGSVPGGHIIDITGMPITVGNVVWVSFHQPAANPVSPNVVKIHGNTIISTTNSALIFGIAYRNLGGWLFYQVN
ncbi:MAG: hypothetical protein SH817_08630 [Leptospira sp.]|nr:hypothetical protein [Leptospira sp.]